MRSACIAKKSDKVTWRWMPRKNQNDLSENFDGKSKDECVKRQNHWDRATQRKEKSSSRARRKGCAHGTQEWSLWAGGGSSCGRTWRWHQGKFSTKRTKWTIWQVEEDSTIFSKKLRMHQRLPTHQRRNLMDERVVTSEKCWIWYRGEDVGDFKRSELNEVVENSTCLNAFEGKFGSVFRKSWWMIKLIRRSWWMQYWWMKKTATHKPTIFGRIYWCKWTVIVDWNSEKRSILCDTVLGKTLCEFGSKHEKIDVISWRSCDDAMKYATALCWTLLATWTSRRTCIVQKTHHEESQKKKSIATSWKDLYIQMKCSEDAIRIEWVC